MSARSDALGLDSYADEIAFLRQHVEVLELRAGERARVALVPAWQARVATSCTRGDRPGFGWLNHDFIASGASHDRIHAYGGEDRLWIGPEAGQFSLFHDPGDPFDVAHWRTPAAIDREAYEVSNGSETRVRFRHRARLTNWSGSEFTIEIERTIRALPHAQIGELLEVDIADGEDCVGFESTNTLRNVGPHAWSEEGGMLALWMIGMFRASDASSVVIPFRAGPESELGPIVNDRYFGAVPRDRLRGAASTLHFRADAKHRSKIGLSPRRALDRMGSYDADSGALTIVHYDVERDARYVNQIWEQQAEPFDGDVIHSYNDGRWSAEVPQLGAFYELEASSPARALALGEAVTQHHRTLHFAGGEASRDAIARAALGVGLDELSI